MEELNQVANLNPQITTRIKSVFQTKSGTRITLTRCATIHHYIFNCLLFEFQVVVLVDFYRQGLMSLPGTHNG